ncbi:MAG: oligosaccharide flippase family protein [Candidatus Paceibacterota bacterium]
MINKLKSRAYDFLRWSQKYTGTDNVYLAKGGSWLTLGQVISASASFLLAVAFANLIDPTTYGNYKYILSLIGILGIFSLPGIETAIIQATARNLEGSFYTGFKTKLKWSLLGSLAAIGGAVYYWLQGNDTLPIPLLISAIFLPLTQASQVYTSFLTGKKLFNIKVKYSSFSQIISVIAMIATLFLTKNLFWLIAVHFVSYTFLNFFFYWLTQKKFQPNKKDDPQTLSYGKHLSLMDVTGQIATYLDRILIFHYLGTIPLAIYQFAITPPEQIKGLLKNIPLLALPKLTTRSKEEINRVLYKRIFQSLLIGGIMTLTYILIAPFFYKIFFPKYLDSIFFSQLFAITIILRAVSYLIGSAFQAKKLVKAQYIGTISSYSLLIFLLLLLGNLWGIIGIIIAKILFLLFSIIISIILWRKEILRTF